MQIQKDLAQVLLLERVASIASGFTTHLEMASVCAGRGIATILALHFKRLCTLVLSPCVKKKKVAHTPEPPCHAQK